MKKPRFYACECADFAAKVSRWAVIEARSVEEARAACAGIPGELVKCVPWQYRQWAVDMCRDSGYLTAKRFGWANVNARTGEPMDDQRCTWAQL